MSDITYECDEKMISAQMYAFPMNLNWTGYSKCQTKVVYISSAPQKEIQEFKKILKKNDQIIFSKEKEKRSQRLQFLRE